MPELGSMTRKRGQKERPSQKKLDALAVNRAQPHPGKRAWKDDEIAARVEAVRKLRVLTPVVVDKIMEMLNGPLQPIELASLARVVFDRGGVPPVTQMELVGDQIPQTLVVSFAQRQAALGEERATAVEETKAAEQSTFTTNGSNGTAH